MKLGEMDLNEAALKAAGNWENFQCFVWFRDGDLPDADQWAVMYTHHRDSGLLDQSNASVINREMIPYTQGEDPDVVFESHSHWAVGHIDGFSMRVFRNGQITGAFQKYHELLEQIEAYPILDDEDYSNREYEATVENIDDAAWKLKHDFQLPEDWSSQVYDWLSDFRSGEIENRDDQGGYPSEEALRNAFAEIGFAASG